MARKRVRFSNALQASAEAVGAWSASDTTGLGMFIAVPFISLWWWIAGVPETVARIVWPESESD